MQKKSKLLYILFFISIVMNVYLGITSYIKSTYTSNLDDQDILEEMTKMIIESEQYEDIASRETVYAINKGVNRFNVANPSPIFHYKVYVKTEKQTYIFNYTDKLCANVSNEGWT